jgi:transposase
VARRRAAALSPKELIGEAIGYAVGQWDALTLFLTDPHLPIDNNASERALRVAALGRKNFLFVGHDDAGENLAGLYSFVATCEANSVNPVDSSPTSCCACRATPLADR